MNESGKVEEISESWNEKFLLQNMAFARSGERVLGFAKLHLPREPFEPGYIFNIANEQTYNFPLYGFTFLGLISLIDPPKKDVPFAVLKCKSAGIKVIMITGDHPATALSIARQVNIIPFESKTADEIVEETETEK
jgi:sodium/potassium-transporting ATPase subunit alpha